MFAGKLEQGGHPKSVRPEFFTTKCG